MTGEAWTIAIAAYLLCGVVVALWLWPVDREQSGADELVRGLIFAGWPCALLGVVLAKVITAVGAALTWVGRPGSRA